MRTCALIPCYNEASTIRDVVEGALSYIEDIIVIDDGSTDETGGMAHKGGAMVICHRENKGKGEAIRTGFNYIKGSDRWDSVIIMDGDGQHDWNEIPGFMEIAQSTKAAIVIGDRMTGILPFRHMPIIRWLTNKTTSYIISILAGQWIPDSQCGYRFIRTDVIKDLKLFTSRFETESEILIKSARRSYRIVSLPIKTIYRGEISHINPVRDTLRFIKLIYANICRKEE